MGESFGVSVSFGKYENDGLSWEKWSAFSPNKYLEEVGKCSTPGSVAQKKAFFEAHYKKIAAMKAEAELQLEQEKAEAEAEAEVETDDRFQQVKEESQAKASVVEEQVEEEEEEATALPSVTIKDAIFGDGSMQHLLPCQSLNTGKADKQHFKLDADQETRPKAQNQVDPTKVELGKKEKPLSASRVPKSLEMPSKPKVTPPTPMPANNSSSKKANAINKPWVAENRKIAPTSLHLSISMSSVNSDTASSVTSSVRRSLFMEQMGDKDIVKRAFKTFQNRVNQLPSSGGAGPKPKQLPTQKASTSVATQKENDRSRKASEKINPLRGQLGPIWKSVSSGSLKGVGVLKAAPSSVCLESNERAERRKEFMKKLEEKSNARDAERSHISSTAKEVKDVEMKMLRQNPTFKAKPMPSFYRTQATRKSTSEKDAVKNGTQRRPNSHSNISR